MYSILAAILALTPIIGGWLIYQGWHDRRDPSAPTKHRKVVQISRKTQLLIIIGIAIGAAGWLITGWFICLVIAPALTVGLPQLLGKPAAEAEIARLNAMEEWVRNLSGVLSAGAGIEQAIIATHRSIPSALDAEISKFIQRLRSNTPINDALRRFAADLDDSTGDLVAGALIQAAALRGTGLAAALNRLAMSVSEDVRNRRAVEAARKGARTTARWVTIITVGFVVALFVATDFMNFYSSPLGQILFLAFAAAFAAVLWWMKALTKPIKFSRFLGKPASSEMPVHLTERTPA